MPDKVVLNNFVKCRINGSLKSSDYFWPAACYESLFLGFLKEDLFYFFKIIFQDFFIFHLYSYIYAPIC